ncbi:cytochrome P450 [Pseudomonas fulva]|uniref:cytochrome P450 n=1 Tax=Pseudomonas fulva TaxID=47880 RepID=UPI0018AC3924|nr:cytochrome P450 [Pseudomonas fulva]MBF8674176.1 cytochrome P450 [Pseudomonas fulva]MBF8695835.1 cytochrome P450 [Pseudomonas fulva]
MTSPTCPVAYPFNRFTDLQLADAYRDAQQTPGLLRIQMPIGAPAWLATRYDDVRLVLGDRRFSRGEALRRPDAPRAFARIAGGIVMMDPPQLTRIRSLAAQAFTRRRVEALRPHTRAHAHQLIDRMLAAGPPADLVNDFALPIPLALICELLGVPLQDRDRFKRWNDSLLSTRPEDAAQTQQHLGELAAYIKGLVAERRHEARDDFMTALTQAHEQGECLNEEQLLLLCIAILVAGYEGSASQIPNFIQVLLDNPQQWQQLKNDPEQVPTAVEELLRYIPLASAAMFVHYALEDIQVGTTLVRQGEAVFASIGAANYDPARFPAPDTLDLQRDTSGHLGFGHGLHHCIGSSLARIELQEALRALVERMPNLQRCGESQWKTDTFFRGAHCLPVTWS